MTTKNDKSPSKAALDNRSRQLNPNDGAFASSGGSSEAGGSPSKAALDNRSRQLNPRDPAYAASRGESERKNG